MKLTTNFHEQDGRLIVAQSQDCTAIAEHAKMLHNSGQHGTSEMKHAASLPRVIVEKYLNESGVSFQEFMNDPVHIKRVVEHPDNAMFRVWKGAI